MHQVVVSDWQNWCRNLSDVNICFQSNDCSAEYRNGMTSVKDAEYSGCLPADRMYRNVEHVMGFVVKVVVLLFTSWLNELGSVLVFVVKF